MTHIIIAIIIPLALALVGVVWSARIRRRPEQPGCGHVGCAAGVCLDAMAEAIDAADEIVYRRRAELGAARRAEVDACRDCAVAERTPPKAKLTALERRAEGASGRGWGVSGKTDDLDDIIYLHVHVGPDPTIPSIASVRGEGSGEPICTNCGSTEIEEGFGLAGGGYGTYLMCMACSHIVAKDQCDE